LGVYKPLYSLVAGNEGREQDDEHNDHPRQVFDPPIAIREAPARTEACEREGDPKWHSGRRVAEVVDGIRQEGDAAGEDDHSELQEGGHEQGDERPLHGPDAALGGRYGGIHSAVGVAVPPVVIMLLMFFAVMVCHGGDSTANPALFTQSLVPRL
jgi:hypothetical protein